LFGLPCVDEATNCAPLEWEPGPKFLQPIDGAVFFAIAEPWITEPCPYQRDLLSLFCHLHAELTCHRDKLPDYIVTLHNLRRVSITLEKTFPVLQTTIESKIKDLLENHYLQHLGKSGKNEDWAVFRSCLSVVGLDEFVPMERVKDR
jgi:hypothetical protein